MQLSLFWKMQMDTNLEVLIWKVGELVANFMVVVKVLFTDLKTLIRLKRGIQVETISFINIVIVNVLVWVLDRLITSV